MIKFQAGFTLIELLVVIFIIGTLTGIILPNFVGSRQRARDARRKQDLGDIKNALRMYYNDNQAYPENVSDLTSGGNNEYINSIPEDPTNGDYGYCRSDDEDGFVLCADLENEGDSDNLLIGDSDCDGICSDADEATCCTDDNDRCYFICGR